ncbi:MAG: diguanylate cyclase protein [Panacagrimonas sp.]|jgi:diguanylate cyclase (GGDEF)-like protein|nr:diguanylate cyclase [Panacagrimonas sp.]MCC2657365.1 diguanylate cyclase protein [Panacagrimonas sp.]
MNGENVAPAATLPDLAELPKILVVDDTPANLVAMRRLLRNSGARVIEAASGNEALAACLDHEFALILLDVQMPDIDGFEVAALLSEETRTRDTPIIFVTAAYGDDLNRLKGYKHGAVDYIAKPVNDVVLLSKVRVFLELYNGKRMMRDLLDVLGQRNAELEREVAERKRLEELARHQAGHDALTGLPNRLLFMDRLSQAVARSERRHDRLALLYIDLDGFKPINDRYGHLAGDLALKKIASSLEHGVRKSDTCARLGGDEFAIIMDGAPDGEAQRLGQKLCDLLRQPFELDLEDGRVQVQVGASIGIALFAEYDPAVTPSPSHEERMEDLIRIADAAMYESKRTGKNRVTVAARSS